MLAAQRPRPRRRCSCCPRPTSTARGCCPTATSRRCTTGSRRLAADADAARRGGPPDPRRRARRAGPGRRRARRRGRRPGRGRQGAATSGYARAYRGRAETVDDGLKDGRLLRGEVLARWQEFVGTGEFLRGLEARIGRLRDRIVAAVTGRPAPGKQLQHRARVPAGHAAARGRGGRRRARVHRLAGPPGRAPRCSSPRWPARRPTCPSGPTGWSATGSAGARSGPARRAATSGSWRARRRTRSTPPAWP